MELPRPMRVVALLLLLAPVHLSASSVASFFRGMVNTVPTYRCTVLRTYPHSRSSFTQGLYYEDSGMLVESTGLYGGSRIRRVRILDGKVVHEERLPNGWFGEGVTVCKGRCIQLLWREGLAVVRDPKTFEVLRTYPLPRGLVEGWGLTHGDDGMLYASDGSAHVRVVDPVTMATTRTLTVTIGGVPLWPEQLNELQWVHGKIVANLWHQDRLVVFDPQSGRVECFVDMSNLMDERERKRLSPEEVLNGIAYDKLNDRLFVTGKCWLTLFQVGVDLGPELGRVGYGLKQKR